MPETLNDLDGRAWMEHTQSWFTIPALKEPGWDVKRAHPQTIPIALVDALACGRLKKGDLTMLLAVGAGFTTGGLLLRWAY